MSEIKYGQRVNIDPDATYTPDAGRTAPTFRHTPHDPKGEYVVEDGPDKYGNLEIVQRVDGGACAWLWAEERFVTPYVEHDAGEETPPGGGVSRETALAALGLVYCADTEDRLPSWVDIVTGAAPADTVSALAALAEASIRVERIIARSADR